MGGAVDTNTPSNDPFDHEQRFLLSRTEMRRFLEAIAPRTAIEIYDPARPISYTRTTYLDTNDLVYFSSVEGAPARRLRIREYAVAASAKDEPILSGVAFIELKQHEGAARSKMRLSATPERDRPAHRPPRRAPACPEATAPWSAIALELALPTMAPRVSTWYRRLCLTGRGAARADHARRESDVLPAAADRRRGHAGRAGRERDRGGVSRAGPRGQTLRRDAGLAGTGAEALQPADGFSKFQMGMTALGHTSATGGERAEGSAATETVPFALGSFVAA